MAKNEFLGYIAGVEMPPYNVWFRSRPYWGPPYMVMMEKDIIQEILSYAGARLMMVTGVELDK